MMLRAINLRRGNLFLAETSIAYAGHMWSAFFNPSWSDCIAVVSEE
jgi:hypothetical protein